MSNCWGCGVCVPAANPFAADHPIEAWPFSMAAAAADCSPHAPRSPLGADGM